MPLYQLRFTRSTVHLLERPQCFTLYFAVSGNKITTISPFYSGRNCENNRKEKTKQRKQAHSSDRALCLSSFISMALLLLWFQILEHRLTFSTAGDSIALVGKDCSNEVMSCSTSGITTWLVKEERGKNGGKAESQKSCDKSSWFISTVRFFFSYLSFHHESALPPGTIWYNYVYFMNVCTYIYGPHRINLKLTLIISVC